MLVASAVGLIELLNVVRGYSIITMGVYFFFMANIIVSIELISREIEKLVGKSKKLGIDEKWSILEDIFMDKGKCPPKRRIIILILFYHIIGFLSVGMLIEKLTCKSLFEFIQSFSNCS